MAYLSVKRLDASLKLSVDLVLAYSVA